MSYQALENDLDKKFKRTDLTYVGNPTTVIWFTNLAVTYGINLPVRGHAFLEVLKEGKSIATMTCKNEQGGELGSPGYPNKLIEFSDEKIYRKLLGQ